MAVACTSPTRCTAPGMNSSIPMVFAAGWRSWMWAATVVSQWMTISCWRPTVCGHTRCDFRAAMRPRTRTATREVTIMTDTMNWSWAGLLALGAFHGVNPGMGWLFAVALGMQEHRRAAVCRAMLPLALGHALAIAAAVAVAMLAGAVV